MARLKKLLLLGGLLGLVGGAVAMASPVAASPALLPRVNEALRQADFSLTFAHWLPFAEGVVRGHYTTYEQLAGAARWHRQNGTLPDMSRFAAAIARAAQGLTAQTKCMNRVRVSSWSARAITVEYEKGKFRTLRLTPQQYKVALGRSIQPEATVKVCSKDNFKTLAGHVIGLAGLANTTDGGLGGVSEGHGGDSDGSGY